MAGRATRRQERLTEELTKARGTIRDLRREIDILHGQNHELAADLKLAEERADRYEGDLIELGALAEEGMGDIEAGISRLREGFREHGR